MSDRRLVPGRLLAIAAPVFWSIAGVTIRLMEANEWQINFYRSSTLALFVLAVLAVRYQGGTLMRIRATGGRGLLAGLFLGCAMISNIVALKHTSVANAVFFMASGPVIAAIFARLILKELVSAYTWLAILLTVVGMGVMVGGGVIAGSLRGDLIAILGVCFFGVYAVILRGGTDVDMTPAVFYAGAISGSVSGSVALATEAGLGASGRDIGLCVMLGVVQLGIGSVLFALASQTVPAAELTLFSLGEPVLAPLWAWIGVGEVPARTTMLGGAIIVAALAMQALLRPR